MLKYEVVVKCATKSQVIFRLLMYLKLLVKRFVMTLYLITHLPATLYLCIFVNYFEMC